MDESKIPPATPEDFKRSMDQDWKLSQQASNPHYLFHKDHIAEIVDRAFPSALRRAALSESRVLELRKENHRLRNLCMQPVANELGAADLYCSNRAEIQFDSEHGGLCFEHGKAAIEALPHDRLRDSLLVHLGLFEARRLR